MKEYSHFKKIVKWLVEFYQRIFNELYNAEGKDDINSIIHTVSQPLLTCQMILISFLDDNDETTPRLLDTYNFPRVMEESINILLKIQHNDFWDDVMTRAIILASQYVCSGVDSAMCLLKSTNLVPYLFDGVVVKNYH